MIKVGDKVKILTHDAGHEYFEKVGEVTLVTSGDEFNIDVDFENLLVCGFTESELEIVNIS